MKMDEDGKLQRIILSSSPISVVPGVNIVFI
jgi:hypothetical protein